MSVPLSLSKNSIVFELSGAKQKAQEVLEIRNTDSQPQFFKIKTTNKNRYVIKPSQGRIEPMHLQLPEISTPPVDSNREMVSGVRPTLVSMTTVPPRANASVSESEPSVDCGNWKWW